jgi:hypothetical protein
MGDDPKWANVLAKNFFSVSGEHGLIVGATGTGKTQGLYYIVYGIREFNPEETIVWFDCGKSAEILRLVTEFGETTIHIKRFHRVEIRTKDKSILDRIHFKEYRTSEQMWAGLVKGHINVISIEPFFQDPGEYAGALADTFKSLIFLARKYKLLVPMAIFIDEAHLIAPSPGLVLNSTHDRAAVWFQRNVEMLRSLGVRIVATTQGWEKIRKGVRSSIGWVFVKRGCNFLNDRPRLAKYNALWMLLHDDQWIVVFPDSTYSNPLPVEFYGDGKDLGTVLYHEDEETVSPAIPIKAEV